MSASSEMRATKAASLQDLFEVEERMKRRQNDYEERCDADRKALHGSDESLRTMILRVESKTDEGNAMVKSLALAFTGIFSQPKVQAVMMSVIMALGGYITYRLHEITTPAPVQPQQPIIVIPQTQIPDAGAPSIIVQPR